MATAGKPIDEESAEKKFSSVKGTQESIQMLAMWVLHHKTHHEKIVALWLKVLKKCKLAQRLTLFYVCNEVVQTCKRKHAIVYKDAFKEILPEATILVRDSSVKSSIERIYRIWEERGVYDGAFVEELISVLNDAKVRPTFAMKMLAEFKPATLVEVIGSFSELEKEIESKRRRLSGVNLDIANKNYTKIMKDRSHGRQYTLQVEEVYKTLDQYVSSLLAEGKERDNLLELLDQSELFYEAQYGEARIVANAYKNFGTRVHNLRKKLTDVRRTLPDPISPVPSPSMDAPSPAASPPPGDTTDNMETVDMDLSDEDTSDHPQEHQKQLQQLLHKREQLQQQLAKYNLMGSTNHNTEDMKDQNIGDVSDAAAHDDGEKRMEGLGGGGYSPTKVSEGSGSPSGPAFSPLSSPNAEQSGEMDEWKVEEPLQNCPTYDPSEQQGTDLTSSHPPSNNSTQRGGETLFSQRVSSLFSVLHKASAQTHPSPPRSNSSQEEIGINVPSSGSTLVAPSQNSFSSLEALSSKLGIRLQGSSATSTGSNQPSVGLLDRFSTCHKGISETAMVGSDPEDDEIGMDSSGKSKLGLLERSKMEEIVEEQKSSNASYLSGLLANFGGRQGPSLPGLAEGVVDEDEESDEGNATPVMDEYPAGVLPLGAQNPVSAAATSTVDPLDLLNRLLNRSNTVNAPCGVSNGIIAPPVGVLSHLSSAAFTGNLGGPSLQSGAINHAVSYPGGVLGGNLRTSIGSIGMLPRSLAEGYITSSGFPAMAGVTLGNNMASMGGESMRSVGANYVGANYSGAPGFPSQMGGMAPHFGDRNGSSGKSLSLVQYEGDEDCVSPPRAGQGWGFGGNSGGRMQSNFSNISPSKQQIILGSPSHGLTSSLPQRPLPYPSPHPSNALLSPSTALPASSLPSIAPARDVYPVFETNMTQQDSRGLHQQSGGATTNSFYGQSPDGHGSISGVRFGSNSPPPLAGHGSYEYTPPVGGSFGPNGFVRSHYDQSGSFGSVGPSTFHPPQPRGPANPPRPPPPPLPQEPFHRGEDEGFGPLRGPDQPPLPLQLPPNMPPLPRGPIRLPAPPHLPPRREGFEPPERRFSGNSGPRIDHPFGHPFNESEDREFERHDPIGYDILRESNIQAATIRGGGHFEHGRGQNNGRGQKREFESDKTIGDIRRELHASIERDEPNGNNNIDSGRQFFNNGERNLEEPFGRGLEENCEMEDKEFIDDRGNRGPNFKELGPNSFGPRGGPRLFGPHGVNNEFNQRGGPNLPRLREPCNEFGLRGGPNLRGLRGGPKLHSPRGGQNELSSLGGPNELDVGFNESGSRRQFMRDEQFSPPSNPTSGPQIRGSPNPRMRLPPPPKSGGSLEDTRPPRLSSPDKRPDGPGRGCSIGPLRPRGPGPREIRPPEIRPLMQVGRGAGPPSPGRGGSFRGGPRIFGRARF